MLHRSLGSEDQAENRLMHDIIIRIWRGDCGNLTAKDLTDEYGVLCTVADEDREPELRALVLVEGVVRCMQVGTESARRWALHRLEVSSLLAKWNAGSRFHSTAILARRIR